MLDWQSYVALGLFIVAYIMFIILPKFRTFTALGASLLLIILQVIDIKEASQAINWNVMGIFIGTLFVADIFIESRVPAFLAEKIIQRTPSSKWAILFICLMVSFISAFVENVAALLIVAPVAFALSEKLKISPVKTMIALAISSNLQGAATLIGDPPSMLLGGYAKMSFIDFFFYQGKPSIFFAVEIGAFFSFLVLLFVFRRQKEPSPELTVEKVSSWFPTVILGLLILALAVASFFDTGFSHLAGIICMVIGLFSFFWKIIWKKKGLLTTLKNLDWQTTGFLIGVFIIVGGLSATGWIEVAASFLSNLIGKNLLAAFVLIVCFSILFSAFIDNVPYLATMLPVVSAMALKLQITNPTVLFFGLLIGASLGGNITPIGASANIVAMGLLRKQGVQTKFSEFVKIGLPFTLIATLAASIFIWLIWKN